MLTGFNPTWDLKEFYGEDAYLRPYKIHGSAGGYRTEEGSILLLKFFIALLFLSLLNSLASAKLLLVLVVQLQIQL